MDQKQHTYAALINNKFNHLLSADMNSTWEKMKETLDKEMPEKKKRKWLLWFSTKVGIMAIVLFSLFASATGAFILSKKQKSVKETNAVKNRQTGNERENVKPDVILSNDKKPEYETAEKISPVVLTKSNGKESFRSGKNYTGKRTNKPETVENTLMQEQKDTTINTTPVIQLQVKDSIVISADTPKTDSVPKRRAF
jgi:hypothetical protein